MTARPLAALLCLLGFPAAALADGSRIAPTDLPATDLASGEGAVLPSAAAGHVVFSRQVSGTDRYELVDWMAGRGLRTLPVGTRVIPFDADLGRDSAGRAVLTYSTCTTDGRLGGVLPTLDFTKARGCRIRFVALTKDGIAGIPRTLKLRGSSNLSLTTPSMHGRSIAAVAQPARGSQNARVLYWRTPDSRPERLRGGTKPTCTWSSCPVTPTSGVEALDLGGRYVAFLWRLTDPDIGVAPSQELRMSALRHGTGRQVLRAQGYTSGACGFRQPLSPAAGADGRISFLLAQSPCTALQTTLASAVIGFNEFDGVRPKANLAYGAAWDGDTVYWLAGKPLENTEENARNPIPCAHPAAACRLVVSRDVR